MAKKSDSAAERKFREAVRHHRAGRLKEAAGLYQQVLAASPGNVEALRNLALLAAELGKTEGAAELLRQAAELEPGDARIRSELGEMLRRLGRLEEAAAACRGAIAARPEF